MIKDLRFKKGGKMSGFSLEESVDFLNICLEKRDVTEIKPCQVNLTFDVSVSFDDEHRLGYTQQLLNRFVPFAMLFDKDQTLGSFVFSNIAEQLKDINATNYSDYVNRVIRNSNSYNGGTKYVPIFKMLIDECKGTVVQQVAQKTQGFFSRVFGRQQEIGEYVTVVDKHLHFFVTDGEASDQTQAKLLLDELMAQNKNCYFVFISIANREMSFLKDSFANTDYSDYINFTVDELINLKNVHDNDLYEMLLTDTLIDWMNR